MSEPILLEINDAVAVLTLNRPDLLNAVTTEMTIDYGRRLRALDADPDVRAIVLTGSGRGFCAGADLSELQVGAADLAAAVSNPTTFPDVVSQLRTPVVAAVNGPAAGIGMAYTLGADVRFASTTATFTANFTRIGLVAEYGMSYTLPRLIGYPSATDLLLSGRTVDAEFALRVGLVNAVLEPDDLLPHALAYAGSLAQRCSPRSIAVIKAQLRDDADGTAQAAFARSIRLMVESFDYPDLQEAMRAGQARERPQFPPLEAASVSSLYPASVKEST